MGCEFWIFCCRALQYCALSLVYVLASTFRKCSRTLQQALCSQNATSSARFLWRATVLLFGKFKHDDNLKLYFVPIRDKLSEMPLKGWTATFAKVERFLCTISPSKLKRWWRIWSSHSDRHYHSSLTVWPSGTIPAEQSTSTSWSQLHCERTSQPCQLYVTASGFYEFDWLYSGFFSWSEKVQLEL